VANRTWHFKSVFHHAGNVAGHLWQWEAVSPSGRTTHSTRSFPTLPQCVHDAQQHGFLGAVDAATGTFTSKSYELNVREGGGVIVLSPLESRR
jgi:hypothetical protein